MYRSRRVISMIRGDSQSQHRSLRLLPLLLMHCGVNEQTRSDNLHSLSLDLRTLLQPRLLPLYGSKQYKRSTSVFKCLQDVELNLADSFKILQNSDNFRLLSNLWIRNRTFQYPARELDDFEGISQLEFKLGLSADRVTEDEWTRGISSFDLSSE